MKNEDRGALTVALKMLSRRDYFNAELKAKLLKKDLAEPAVDAALVRCREMGFLDEHKLAKRFAEVRAIQRGWGPVRIRHELKGRGVSEDLASKVADLPDDIIERAIILALKRAEVRAKSGWWRAGEGRSRMVSSLLRRGFYPEHAYRKVADLAAQREASDHAIDDQPGNPEGVS